MSTDADDDGNDSPSSPVEISLSFGESREMWIARDEETGVVSQGATREEALENLDEAVGGYHGEGEPPTAEELRELGVDPADNTSGELPNVLE